tara:strand:+ start:580 stop:762 length:183 start_codon:yes stop_codon:yes gene_type:complete
MPAGKGTYSKPGRPKKNKIMGKGGKVGMKNKKKKGKMSYGKAAYGSAMTMKSSMSKKKRK